VNAESRDIDAKLADHQRRSLDATQPMATECCTQARKDLAYLEGLDDVVIRTRIQRVDDHPFVRRARKNQDRKAGHSSKLTAHRQAVTSRQIDVCDNG
jgi:hypothetical protein